MLLVKGWPPDDPSPPPPSPCGMYADSGAGDEEGEGGVEADKGDVVGVALHGLDAGPGEVVEDLDGAVVAGGDEVGLVGAGVEVDEVDAAALVGLEGEVGGGGGEGPHFDGAVEAGGGEGVGVLGVEGEVHDVVGVSFEDLGGELEDEITSNTRNNIFRVGRG